MKLTKIIPVLFSMYAVSSYSASVATENALPFSETVQAGNVLYLSGQVGLDKETKKLVSGGIRQESIQTMKNIDELLKSKNYELSDVVKCTVFLADLKEIGIFNEVYKSAFANGKYPARSAVAVSDLALDSRVEVECLASK